MMSNGGKTMKLMSQKEATENLRKLGCEARLMDKSDSRDVVKNPDCDLYRKCLEITAHVTPPIANFNCQGCEKYEEEYLASKNKKNMKNFASTHKI